MPIKLHGGKEYYTVVERMDMLLEDQGKENYSLKTDVTYESGVVIVKATLILYKNDVERVYCGHALGELGKAKTLEATETHAIGRCLSAAGWFGSEFASANEMESYQSKPKPKPIPENVNPIEIPAEQIEVGAGISGVDAQDDIKLTFAEHYDKEGSHQSKIKNAQGAYLAITIEMEMRKEAEDSERECPVCSRKIT